MSPADQSVGKQLPYVPEHSASLTGRLSWQTWAFLYKWAFYSERFTMSSNDYTLTGHLPRYFMSNISLEKGLSFKPVDIQLKFAVTIFSTRITFQYCPDRCPVLISSYSPYHSEVLEKEEIV